MNWENNLWGRSKQTDALGASLAALQADLENTLELYDKHFLQLEAKNEALKQENEYLYRYAEEGGMDTDKFFEFAEVLLNECPRCHGTGECDSGATDQQGNWIQIECECQREEQTNAD